MKSQEPKISTPTPASTVILLREDGGELQVYLLRRSGNSGFMAGNYVFPGGAVDEGDSDFQIWKAHVDLAPDEIMQRLGGQLGTTQALAHGVAAVRETLEEAGVFLCCRDKQNPKNLDRVCRLRQAAGLPPKWFSKLVVSEGWTLALSELYRWSHWITPLMMHRRFDTRFFLAVMPAGQICRPDFRETTHGLWITPQQGLAANLAGEIPLSPPALVTMQELLKYQSLKELLADVAERQWGQPLIPRAVLLKKEAVIVEPWDPMYHRETIDFKTDELEQAVLPVGQPFSRIWCSGGIWKPIRN